MMCRSYLLTAILVASGTVAGACSAESITASEGDDDGDGASSKRDSRGSSAEDGESQKASTDPEPPAEVHGLFDLNDVSILFPLGGVGDSGLMQPSLAGAQGELLPLDLFSQTPKFTGPAIGPSSGSATKADEYASLRVVALRVDPCFPSLAGAECRRQVRLVFQPVGDLSGRRVASDQAVHVFYELPEAEHEVFVAQLSSLKHQSTAKTDGVPLGVHPTLAAEGLDGPFARGLRAALLAKAGAKRITRITSMVLPQDEAEWAFQGFDVNEGATKPITIAGTRQSSQSFHVTFGGGSIFPSAPADGDFHHFLEAASQQPPPKPSPDEIAAARAVTFRIDHPEKHTAEDVSCVGCHTAGTARAFAEKLWGVSNAPDTDAFVAKEFDTSVTTPLKADLRSLRAFGYKEATPIANARVINESAAVAKFLNAKLGAK